MGYWAECISIAAEECGLALSPEQLEFLAGSAEGAHENYGMAFYSPPASDRANDLERQWKKRLDDIQAEFEQYRKGAEAYVKRTKNIHRDTQVSIDKYGYVKVYE